MRYLLLLPIGWSPDTDPGTMATSAPSNGRFDFSLE